jgi:hypothetical protein
VEELVQEINSAEILGVLEQIQKVNYMIDLHRLHNETGMVRQFERQREGFLEELRELLASMKIKAELSVLAA